jgi:hypothetical protein
MLGLEPTLRVAVALAVALELRLRVEEGVKLDVGEALPVLLPVPVGDSVGAALQLPEALMLGDTLGLAPLLRVPVGEPEGTREAALPLLLAVVLPLGVGDPVLLPVPDGDAEREADRLMLPVPEGDTEALAQRERLAVGEELLLLLRLWLLLGLPLGVALLEGVPVAVGEAVALWLLLRLREEEPLGLTEGLVPVLRLLVGEAEREALRLALLEGVGAALPLPL